MAYATAALNEMLDGLDVDTISLHSGAAGASGTSNEVSGSGYARGSVTFNAASGGERLLSADETFAGPADQAVAEIGLWGSSGTVFKGSLAVTGDAAFNADGEYVVKGTTTKLTAANA